MRMEIKIEKLRAEPSGRVVDGSGFAYSLDGQNARATALRAMAALSDETDYLDDGAFDEDAVIDFLDRFQDEMEE